MTEVGALAGGLAWSCATLAMLASVLSRFIWPIAMETDAGARLPGIRGCDIIMKGNWSKTKEGKGRKPNKKKTQFLILSTVILKSHQAMRSNDPIELEIINRS